MNVFIRKLFLFSAILLAMAVLLEVSLHLLKIEKTSYHNIHAKAQNLIPEVNSRSIVFLGDSRIEWGIKPLLIDNPGGKVYNLAFPGNNGADILKYMLGHKIYPKVIVIGYTVNYGRYLNHGFDKTSYSYKRRILENMKYYLLESSYVYDKQSIYLDLNGEKPYFIHHDYDANGGVTVVERGDYQQRMAVQRTLYKTWSKDFSLEKYKAYEKNIADLLMQFKGRSFVIGLYMPVSNEIYAFENHSYNKATVEKLFNRYLDCSAWYSAQDSLGRGKNYFYDGSHLSPETAVKFTSYINKELKSIPWLVSKSN